MKNASLTILGIFTLAFCSVLCFQTADAQFSRPVCVLKGCVLTADQKPATVRLSIHETGTADTSDEITTCAIQEITAGRANSESGRYLLVLKPNTKYWVHIEGTFVQSLDTLIATPNTNKSLSIDQNFVVNWRQAQDPATTDASSGQPGKKE
ncbi:MAG: hypothetical protein ACHQNE_08420 [Candidatus Kapaibacterium sp.]